VFPARNTGQDGYEGAAPVGCFKANGLGIHDMIGNVWEWTSDPYRQTRTVTVAPGEPGADPRQPGVAVGVIKGGSYLCAPNYCMRYRPGARQAQDLTLGASHVGFRTVAPMP
jgi:formylglycine-generating enzyme required for sulfatase activity